MLAISREMAGLTANETNVRLTLIIKHWSSLLSSSLLNSLNDITALNVAQSPKVSSTRYNLLLWIVYENI